jgi:hypothetical protein
MLTASNKEHLCIRAIPKASPISFFTDRNEELVKKCHPTASLNRLHNYCHSLFWIFSMAKDREWDFSSSVRTRDTKLLEDGKLTKMIFSQMAL